MLQDQKEILTRNFTGYGPDRDGLITARPEDIQKGKYDIPIDKTYINMGGDRIPLDLYMEKYPFDRYYIKDVSSDSDYVPGTSKHTIISVNPYTKPVAGSLADAPGNDLNGGFNNGLNNLMIAGVAVPRAIGLAGVNVLSKDALKLSEGLLPSGWTNAAVQGGMVSQELAPTILGLGYMADAALVGPSLYSNLKEGNYGSAALDATLLYTPMRAASFNALHNVTNATKNLGQRARNAIYYNISPMGYEGHTKEIGGAITSFFNPSWKFDPSRLPKWWNSSVKVFKPNMTIFRDLAWRKAMRIPEYNGYPKIYKSNGDGTWSYDLKNIEAISNYTGDIHFTPKTTAPSHVLFLNADKKSATLRPIIDGTPTYGYDGITTNGGFGKYERLPNGDVVFSDHWRIHPFNDYLGRGILIPLPEVLSKKVQNIDLIRLVGGDPFKVRTVLPAPKGNGSPNYKFKNGGRLRLGIPKRKISIDPKNKGKFTETKKRTGKTTEELTHSKNKLTKKRAIFALNAAKWNHSKQYVQLARNGMKYPAYMINYGMNPTKFRAMFDALRLRGISNLVSFEVTWQSMKEKPTKYYAFGRTKNTLDEWADSCYKSLTTGGYKAARNAKNFKEYRQKTFKYNTLPNYTHDLLQGREGARTWMNEYIKANNLGEPIVLNDINLNTLDNPDYQLLYQDNIPTT